MDGFLASVWHTKKNKLLSFFVGSDDKFLFLRKACLWLAVFYAIGIALFLTAGYIKGKAPTQLAIASFAGLVMMMFMLILGLISSAIYQRRRTDNRLRGLADYVEELRAYTVPRIDSIEDFLEKNAGVEETPPPPTVVPTEPAIDKPLGTRERDTLLTIIAALAKEAKLQIDQPGKTALYIEGLTNELGAPVSKRAIEDHLKKIPNALEARMK